tara:strand:+ start:1752 stop:2327 length:576 start_codon:yes stop_codon:yes gene_type:complete
MDEPFNEKLNLDELYERTRETSQTKIKTYQKILARIHTRIKAISRQRNNNKFCMFVIPEFILGIPRYDIAECTNYVIEKLTENGFQIKYTYPNLLFISWQHYIPKYQRSEIKKKTGVAIDGFGNVVTKKNKNNREDSNPNSLLLMDKNGKTKDGKKKPSNFKSTSSYKPTGNLIYNTNLLKKIDLSLDNKN